MIRDIHLHLSHGMPLEEAVVYFKKLMHRNNVDKITLLSIPSSGVLTQTQNLFVLAAKQELYPDCFAYMGLTHEAGHADYLTQLERGLKQGFDGLKILESKPDIQKRLGLRMSDPMFDEMYSRAEELNLPVLMHVADPITSWDRNKIDKWALEHGRCYDGAGFLSREDLYGDVEKILQKHPNLRLTLAHFYFLADELERADDFLSRHPTVCFDLTPGKEMYLSFSANPEKSADFFRKYADRLYFGTDVNDGNVFDYHCDLYHLVKDMLCGSAPFDLWGNHYIPLGLEKTVCDKIFCNNHRSLLGDIPKPICQQAIQKELKRLKGLYDTLSTYDKKSLSYLNEKYEYFIRC